MLAHSLPILIALSLTACGVFPKEKSKHGSDSPDDDSTTLPDGADDGTDGNDDHGDGGGEGQSIDFKQFLLVREPAQSATDTAAIFLFKPSRGTFTVSEVKGPKFLGNAQVGKLDAETLKKLFVDLSSPLPEEQKQKLLTDYADATIVYFQKYDGRLCSDEQFHLELTGTVEEIAPTAIYDFNGSTGNDGNCFFHSLSLLQTYSETK